MTRILSGLLGLLFAVAFVYLLISNQQRALLSLDPTSQTDPQLAFGPFPVAVHIVVGLLIGFALGAIGMWSSGARRRRELRERRREVRRLQDELAEARQGLYRAEPAGTALVPTAQAQDDAVAARV